MCACEFVHVSKMMRAIDEGFEDSRMMRDNDEGFEDVENLGN